MVEDDDEDDASWEARICRMPEGPPLPGVSAPTVLVVVLAVPAALAEGGKAKHARG